MSFRCSSAFDYQEVEVGHMIQKLLALARGNSVFRPGGPFKIWYNSFAGIFDLEKSCTKCKWMKIPA